MTTSLVQNAPKRRDTLVIMVEILRIAKVGALKTQIMYKANLSFDQLRKYLNLLAQKKLLEKRERNGKETYIATEKGIALLERHSALNDLLK